MNKMIPISSTFLDKCAKVTEAYDRLSGGWSLDSQLFHIVKEVSELSDVLRNKQYPDGHYKYGVPLSKEWYKYFYDELADVHLTVFSTDNFLDNLEYYDGRYIDVRPIKINRAILNKLSIVTQRVIDWEERSKELSNSIKNKIGV